ncbi:MAG TPA: 2-oxoglutarate and iron-dependent oxygenase domain-containing protein, partial [SAR86 cluster bacterium]|nr:2-oxoglutarate and iron-dependent oxygenase domain-containing protein [SAR86 cluster bacterium]
MSDLIKTLSFKLWEEDPDQFVELLGKNHKLTGFCAIKDHPIEPDLVNSCIKMMSEFFALPEDIKMKYFDEGLGGARGYTPYKIET